MADAPNPRQPLKYTTSAVLVPFRKSIIFSAPPLMVSGLISITSGGMMNQSGAWLSS
uniref:Uncharacterized protein n=1 Tax=Arundo donax TaxID=35708 RepID=A0A0A9FFW5_ARUDO